MTFCPNKPLTVRKRLAKVVPNGTSGNTTMGETLWIRVPSPRVQCLLSLAPLAADLNDSATFFYFDTTAVPLGNYWVIQPALDLLGDLDVKNYRPTTIGVNGSVLQDVFGGTGQPLPVTASLDYGVSYLLAGESHRLWKVFVSVSSPHRVGAAPSGYVMFHATFEPKPETNMSNEEWAYWRGLCAVEQMIGDTARPPSLDATP